MRLRSNKIKREHSIIKDVFQILEKIQENNLISAIIPGRIKPVSGQNSTVLLQFTTITDSGIKLIAKSDRAVQEIFIVTDKPQELIESLKIDGFIK